MPGISAISSDSSSSLRDSTAAGGSLLSPIARSGAMGTVYGAVFLISCGSMGLGSWGGGAIHDALGTYQWLRIGQWLFIGSFAIGAAAALLGVALRAPARLPIPAR